MTIDYSNVSVMQRLRGVSCPVHPDHKLALVGEAPGPNTRTDCPFYPYPPSSAAGRLLALLGWSRGRYLLTFARVNMFDEWPGSTFPVSRARLCVPQVIKALHPRPMLLMGKGVAAAFGVVGLPPCALVERAFPVDGKPVVVTLALVPHTSGRNHWYNDPGHRRLVHDFINDLARITCDSPTVKVPVSGSHSRSPLPC